MMVRGALPAGSGSVWIRSVLIASAVLGGCGDGASGASTASVMSSGSAKLPGSAAGSSAEPSAPAFDPKAFCGKLCKRSSDCGLQKVEILAKSGDPTDLATLEKEKARRGEVEKSCIETCSGSSPAGPELERAKAAEACVAEPDCPAFERCLQAVAVAK